MRSIWGSSPMAKDLYTLWLHPQSIEMRSRARVSKSCDLVPSCTLRTGRMFLFGVCVSGQPRDWLVSSPYSWKWEKLWLYLRPCSLCSHHPGRHSICKAFFFFSKYLSKVPGHDDVQPGYALCFTCFNSALWQLPKSCPVIPNSRQENINSLSGNISSYIRESYSHDETNEIASPLPVCVMGPVIFYFGFVFLRMQGFAIIKAGVEVNVFGSLESIRQPKQGFSHKAGFAILC